MTTASVLSILLAGVNWTAQLDLASANLSAGRPHEGKTRYERVYDGIHLDTYRNAAGELEYDFLVEPGADPGRIALSYPDAVITAEGDLIAGRLRHRAPVSYQLKDGRREAVASRFVRRGAAIGFEVGHYDATRMLVIDPVLTVSRFIENSGENNHVGFAQDATGNLYVMAENGMLTKTTAAGVNLFQKVIQPFANFGNAAQIAVDSAGNVYIAGTIGSTCPANSTRVIGSVASPGVFLAFSKMSPDAQSTVYLTCVRLDGSSRVGSIAVDGAGNMLVAGFSNAVAYPASAVHGTLQPGANFTFVTKVDSTGGSFPISVLVGQSGGGSSAAAFDTEGNIYLTGLASSQFQTLNATQAAFGGGGLDGFLMKIAAAGNQVLFATFLGGSSNDSARALALDSLGNVVIAGDTNSVDFPIAGSAARNCASAATGSVGFVSRIHRTTGALVSSTCLDRSGSQSVNSVAIQGGTEALVTGVDLGSVLLAKVDRNGGQIFRFRLAGTSSGASLGDHIVATSRGWAVAGSSSQSDFPRTTGPALSGSVDPILAIYDETVDLSAESLNNTSVRVRNFGPDVATSVELRVGILGFQVTSMDSRCSSLKPTLIVCKFGNMAPNSTITASFVTSVTPNLNVKSSVFDPNLNNNHN